VNTLLRKRKSNSFFELIACWSLDMLSMVDVAGVSMGRIGFGEPDVIDIMPAMAVQSLLDAPNGSTRSLPECIAVPPSGDRHIAHDSTGRGISHLKYRHREAMTMLADGGQS
jgi:hypothetical protein